MSSASQILSRKTGPTATAEALRTLAKGQGKHRVFNLFSTRVLFKERQIKLEHIYIYIYHTVIRRAIMR